jgi:hypothetical protein
VGLGDSARLDIALLTFISRSFFDGDPQLQNDYADIVAAPRGAGRIRKLEPSDEYKGTYDLLIGVYLVSSCALIGLGLLAVLYLPGAVSTIVAVGASLVFGPVAAQACGHGILAPALHRGPDAGRPWGNKFGESTIAFAVLSLGFSAVSLAILYL